MSESLTNKSWGELRLVKHEGRHVAAREQVINTKKTLTTCHHLSPLVTNSNLLIIAKPGKKYRKLIINEITCDQNKNIKKNNFVDFVLHPDSCLLGSILGFEFLLGHFINFDEAGCKSKL